MGNFMKYSLFIAFIFIGSTGLKAASFFEKTSSEILLHAGVTGHRTKLESTTYRDDITQLGYDFKFTLESWKLAKPFLSARGALVYGKVNTSIGLGMLADMGKSEFQVDLARERGKKISKAEVYAFGSDIVLYRFRVLLYTPFLTNSTRVISWYVGLGLNTHGEDKIFKFNRGEYSTLGLRFLMPNKKDSTETFIYALGWERDVIKSANLKQERNMFLVKAGKRF